MNSAPDPERQRHLLGHFFTRLARANGRVLFLDYDGTLAPFRTDRLRALPYRGVPQLLDEMLANGHTRVVVVSGRAAEEVIALLGLQRRPEVWGSHGWERLTADGRPSMSKVPGDAKTGLDRAWKWAAARQLEGHCERKHGSLAFHWRGEKAHRIKKLERSVREGWSAIAQSHGLLLREFDGGLELRVPGRDKSSAVQTVLSEMSGDVAAAYLGDDSTDEDAFAAIAGRGLSVLVRRTFRPTLAQVWLRPPHELLDFLRQWNKIAGGSGDVFPE